MRCTKAPSRTNYCSLHPAPRGSVPRPYCVYVDARQVWAVP
jgi:hypothetical protein